MSSEEPDIPENDIRKTELRTSWREYERFKTNVGKKHGKTRGITGIEAGRAFWLWNEVIELGMTPEEAVALVKYQRNVDDIRSEVDELCEEIQSAVSDTRAELDAVLEGTSEGDE